MKSGTYYIGDLCYVLSSDEWDELIDVSMCEDGQYTLDNGKTVFYMGTAHGDGCYTDQTGHEYAVDSGTIGCVLAHEVIIERPDLGKVVEQAYDFEPFEQGGDLYFGTVVIETNPQEEWD